MPKYIVEREIPNAAALSAADLKGIAQRTTASPPLSPRLGHAHDQVPAASIDSPF